MAIILCNECGKFFDGDWEVPEVDPRDDCAELCEDCYLAMTDEDGNLLPDYDE